MFLDYYSVFDYLELEWTDKIMNMLRMLQKQKHPLSVHQKEVLASLNNAYRYKLQILGNRLIEHSLKKLNEHKFLKEQSIKKLTQQHTQSS